MIPGLSFLYINWLLQSIIIITVIIIIIIIIIWDRKAMARSES